MLARVSLALLFCTGLLCIKSVAAEDAPDIKGDKVTLKGEVIDVWCYMEGGDRGADHKKCAVACIKAGNPVGLLDEKGNVFILLGGKKDHQPGQEMLIDKVAETVTVEGTMVKKGDSKVVFVTSVK
jgi:hypothetical protein